MPAEIYDLTPERILERLEQFRANFGVWPAVRDIGGHGRWLLADLAGRLHAMESQGLVVCDPGRVYRPRGAAPNPTQLTEVTRPVETQVPAVHATKARPGRRAIPFPPPEQLLAEAEAALAAGENAVAVLGARYGAVKSTTRNRLRRAHIHVHGLNAPPPWWTPNRRPRPLRAALTRTEAETTPLQDAQPARVEAPDAMEEGGQGGNIPEVVTGAQGDLPMDRHSLDTCDCGHTRYVHGHRGICQFCEFLSRVDPCGEFRLSKRYEADAATEVQSDAVLVGVSSPHKTDASEARTPAQDALKDMSPMKPQTELPRPRPWTSSTVVPLPLLLRLLLEEIENDATLRRVLKRLAGEVA